MSAEELILRLAAIVFLGVGAQWLAARLHIPSILLLLSLGLVAGAGTGFIRPDELFGELLVPAVSLSVAVILFEGGLGLRGVGLVVRNLIIAGSAVTLLVAATFAYYVLNLSLSLSLLLGALLVVLVYEAIFAEGVEEATVQAIQAVSMTLVAGVGIGLLAAGVIVVLLRRYLIPDELQNPVTLMALITATAAANWAQAESGLVAASARTLGRAS